MHNADYLLSVQSNEHLRRLDSLVNQPRYLREKGDKRVNIICMARRQNYFIPYANEEPAAEYSDDEEAALPRIPMMRLFYYAERCRVHNIPFHLLEKQYYELFLPDQPFLLEKEPEPLPALPETGAGLRADDGGEGTSQARSSENEDEDEEPVMVDELDVDVESILTAMCEEKEKYDTKQRGKAPEPEEVAYSGIDLDFDIYQSKPERGLDKVIGNVVRHIACELARIIKHNRSDIPADLHSYFFDKSERFTYHAAIIAKPAVRAAEHKKYGQCFKESFHLRIPGIQVTKAAKAFLRRSLLQKKQVAFDLEDLGPLGALEEILDGNAVGNPILLLGAAKLGSSPAQFYKLFRIVEDCAGDCSVKEADDFAPIGNDAEVRLKEGTRTGKTETTSIPRFKYNLCHELSLHHQAPGGLIKKCHFEMREEVRSQAQTLMERTDHSLLTDGELEATDSSVNEICVRDYQALEVDGLLNLFSQKRAADFESWKHIIIALAHLHPGYKPLAIKFSQRCPESYRQQGLQQLESLWNWALLNNSGEYPTMLTFRSWARQDNPKGYQELMDSSFYEKLSDLVVKHLGKLTAGHFAKCLKPLFDRKVYYDSEGPERRPVWYEFMLPEDDAGFEKGKLYKWRESSSPEILQSYVYQKMPSQLHKVLDYINNKVNRQVGDEELLRNKHKQYEVIKKNLMALERQLGEPRLIENIVKMARFEFGGRAFSRRLDTDNDVIGVRNGVLRLYPNIELLNFLHDKPVSRCVNCAYVPYDENDKHVRYVLDKIRQIFAGDEESFNFFMCFMASSLDGRRKRPYLFIMLGGGSNGKSTLLELHIKTLGLVTKDGYACKLDISFYTHDVKNPTGPDSQKMMLKFSRMTYSSETEYGVALRISKVKEITSETLTASEKYQKQDTFEGNCLYILCSNHDPQIKGHEYGAWRRILAYNFKMKFCRNPNPNDRFEAKDDARFYDYEISQEYIQTAYLSILTHYYYKLHHQYGGLIDSVPHENILRETQVYQDTQDTISRFITQRMVHVGPTIVVGDQTCPTPHLELSEVAARYISWYAATVGGRPPLRGQIIDDLKDTRLKKYIVKGPRFEELLSEHQFAGAEDQPVHE